VHSTDRRIDTATDAGESGGDSFGVAVEPKLASLGNIKVSTKGIETTFTIKNSSASKVQILRLESSCGCTVAQPASQVIEPHGETSVLTTVIPKSPGPKDAAVRVFLVRLDNNRKDTLQLRLHWDAVSPLIISPDRIDAGRLLDVDAWNGTFSVETFDGSPITSLVKSIEASPPDSISIHTSLPNDVRDSVSIDLSINGHATVATDHKGVVTLKCSEEIGAIHVPVVWKRSPSVYLEPTGTYKGQIAAGSELHSKLTLNCALLEIVGVQTSPTFNAGFKATPLSKSVWQIIVEGTAPASAGAFCHEIPVRITFTDNTERSLIYTVTGVVR